MSIIEYLYRRRKAMAINATRKAYLALLLIGVVVIIAGISVYGIYQRDTSQTPTTIYKGLTEAEEEIVKENIKNKIQQQKKKETKIVDNKQPSHVDNAPIQDNSKNEKPGPTYEEPIPTVTKADVSNTEKSDRQSQIEEIQTNIADIENLHKQFAPKDIDWGSGKTIKIASKDDLKKVIADLKKSGDPKHSAIIDFLKNADMDDNKRIELHIAD